MCFFYTSTAFAQDAEIKSSQSIGNDNVKSKTQKNSKSGNETQQYKLKKKYDDERGLEPPGCKYRDDSELELLV